MIVIVVKELQTNDISSIVKDLKNQGYKVGEDFDFEFSPGKFDWDKLENIPRQTKFTIYNNKLATWLALKWG